MKPFIVSIVGELEMPDGLVVCIAAETLQTATQWARNYFGDRTLDYRNTNVVEFDSVNFDGWIFTVKAHKR